MSAPRRSQTDRGLRAVARVREVRERDSRIGLLHALTTVRSREEELASLQVALDHAAQHDADTLDDFVVSRGLLTGMAVAVREATHRLDAGRTVATQAHARWRDDKARVRAIEQLLERRAQRRADEVARAEVREVDDIVGRLQLRRTQEVAR
jgi:flagellar FliJ protein